MHQRRLQIVRESLKRWVLESRRSSDTWLITKGHILKPPFRIEDRTEKDILRINLLGSNDSISFKMNNAVVSDFRDQLGVFLIDEDEIVSESHIIAPFPLSKQLILDAFPPGSRFSTEQLYSKVTWADDPSRSQSHARRRWKELKYSYGFDVDWDGMYWRGPSPVPIREPALRPDDNRLRRRFWDQLAQESISKVEDELPHCAYCDGRVIQRGEENIEVVFDGIGLIDHRRPVYQGGDDSISNLQILCQTCNNLKNSTCRCCPYGFKCSKCIWAHPEKAESRRLTIYLDQRLSDALKARAKGGNMDSVVIEILNSVVLENHPN